MSVFLIIAAAVVLAVAGQLLVKHGIDLQPEPQFKAGVLPGLLKVFSSPWVLVGGAVAAIYSRGAYQSGDLDFVLTSYPLDQKKLEIGMRDLGFSQEGRHWKHTDCKHLFIEFCNPPVQVVEVLPVGIGLGR